MTAFQPFTLKSIALLRKLSAAVVHERVESAETLDRRRDRLLHLLGIANRHRMRRDLASQMLANAGGGVVQHFLRAARRS